MGETVVGLIGMSGVGKTTLFNRICCSKNITSSLSRTTTDVVLGLGKLGVGWFGSYRIADTAGLEQGNPKNTTQLLRLAEEANAIVLVLDSRIGATKVDRKILAELCKTNKPFWVAINKSDPGDVVQHQSLSSQGNISYVSASHGIGIKGMLFSLLKAISKTNVVTGTKVLESKQIVVAVVGQRNTGKSSLVNSAVRFEWSYTSLVPGTTKDQVILPFDLGKQQCRFVDTAGYSKRSSTASAIDRQSVLQSFCAISKADIVLLVVDALVGPSNRDLNVLSYSDRCRKPTVLVYNKHDWCNYAVVPISKPKRLNRWECFVSALKCRGVNALAYSIKELVAMLYTRVSSSALSNILRGLTTKELKQVKQYDCLRLSYVHQGSTNPPTFVVHGHNVRLLTKRSAACIANTLRTKLGLEHVHVGIRLAERQKKTIAGPDVPPADLCGPSCF